ncbi:MAG TPA: DUF4239 domain-containing protein [Stellaceae bacterium]|jgi:hypothetical protein|nr:DUF4239 domain-containing protein [Stellaceae bacterium]
MSDWLHNLPAAWMALVVFGATYLVAGVVYAAVSILAVGERARAFKAVSPGMLPPLGILFGLFVAFTAAQVWNDTDRANTAVIREASALRAVVILAASFPGEPEAHMRRLIQQYIEEAATREWPMMAQRAATLTITPQPLVAVLQLTLALNPSSRGQENAQREIVAALENALEARRQRVIVSLSQVNLVKWSCLLVQAISMLLAIAMVHSDNRRSVAIAMGLFASGVAVSVFLILAHDRPFTGEISVGPQPLLQVLPAATTN